MGTDRRTDKSGDSYPGLNGTSKLVWDADSLAEACQAIRDWKAERGELACPECGREPQPSAGGELVCPACDLALVGGCR